MAKEIVYTCPSCGSQDVYAKMEGKRAGVYCIKCNTRITSTTHTNMLNIRRKINTAVLNDNIAIKRIFKYGEAIKMFCPKCNCLLFTSTAPKVEGQFDLVAAKFCPKCGIELI